MSEATNPISEQALADFDLLREDCGLLDLSDLYGLAELTGDDRKGWLQGQATNDVRRLESGNASAFCFASNTGHITAIVDAWAVQDRILLATPVPTLEAVLERVRTMVVMEDVAAGDATQKFRLYSIQGPTATKRLGEMAQLPSLDAGESRIDEVPVYVLRIDRTGLGGWDIWIPTDAESTIQKLKSSFESISHEAFNIARLEAGIPLHGSDYTAKTLPPELGSSFEARHVSYNKGCYMGQEVLMRLHSRGHTNKTWVGLLSESPFQVGDSVSHPLRADAGVVTSATYSPDFGFIGAAMLRNEAVGERETVRIATAHGEVEAEVRRMPILRLE